MKSLMKKVKGFIRDEEGQGLVEYALIIALIAILIIGALAFLRSGIENTYSNTADHLTSGR